MVRGRKVTFGKEGLELLRRNRIGADEPSELVSTKARDPDNIADQARGMLTTNVTGTHTDFTVALMDRCLDVPVATLGKKDMEMELVLNPRTAAVVALSAKEPKFLSWKGPTHFTERSTADVRIENGREPHHGKLRVRNGEWDFKVQDTDGGVRPWSRPGAVLGS